MEARWILLFRDSISSARIERAADFLPFANYRIFLHLLFLLCAEFCLLNISKADQTAPLRSEPYVWRNVAIVAGGFMPGIEFSPAARGLAYIRADNWGGLSMGCAAEDLGAID